MDEAAAKSGITKLGQDNYHVWSVQTKCWLGSKDLFKWTQEKPEAAADGTVPAADDAADKKALYHIGMTLTEEHYPIFEECEHAKDAWEALASLFKNKSQARRLQLKAELSNLRMDPGETLVKYFARTKRLNSQLSSVGSKVPDDELALAILQGLPEEFAMVRKILVNTDKPLAVEDLLPRLLLDENTHEKPVADTKAYVAKPFGGQKQAYQNKGSGKKPKETRKCHYCGKPGQIGRAHV